MLSSCREDNDFVASYSGSDELTMNKAGESFSSQFDALWRAINSNYVAWEIETVDWDAVYDKHYPKFVELDTLVAHGGTVTNEEFTEMYHAVLDTLHDGHSYYSIKNLSTNTYIDITPSDTRNKRRFGIDYGTSTAPFGIDLKYYTSNLVPESERAIKGGTLQSFCTLEIKNLLRTGMDELKKAMQDTQDEEKLALLSKQYEALYTLLNDKIYDLNTKGNSFVIDEYNKCAASNHDARMPQYKTNIADSERLVISSILTKDGIAYLRTSQFRLTGYLKLNDDDLKKMEDNGYTSDATLIRNVIKVWKIWFNNIQTLHKDGKLKGVIIDVRGNSGGLGTDFKYVLGALLPSGGHKIGTYKIKNGTGRLDYSIDFDYKIQTMDSAHAVIDDVPIVALCDHNSCSAAEITAAAIKQLPNGIVIGSQTYGGISTLTPNESSYSHSYSGVFGVEGKTPIYGYQPMSLLSLTGYGVLEGIGVTPSEGYNIEYAPVQVSDPANPSATYYVDNQLEAALKYIRSK